MCGTMSSSTPAVGTLNRPRQESDVGPRPAAPSLGGASLLSASPFELGESGHYDLGLTQSSVILDKKQNLVG